MTVGSNYPSNKSRNMLLSQKLNKELNHSQATEFFFLLLLFIVKLEDFIPQRVKVLV